MKMVKVIKEIKSENETQIIFSGLIHVIIIYLFSLYIKLATYTRILSTMEKFLAFKLDLQNSPTHLRGLLHLRSYVNAHPKILKRKIII